MLSHQQSLQLARDGISADLNLDPPDPSDNPPVRERPNRRERMVSIPSIHDDTV
jgi:hypothetical protein